MGLLLLFSLISLTAGQPLFAQRGVEVISSTETSIELLIRPTVQFETLGNGTLRPILPEGRISNLTEPGSPQEIRIEIPLGLPSATGHTLEVLSVNAGDPLAGTIAPVPDLIRDPRSDLPVETFIVDRDSYRSYADAAPIARFEYGGVARGLHVGRLILAPVRYRSSGNQIDVLESVRVRLRYGGAGTPRSTVSAQRFSPGEIGRVVTSFLNGSHAAAWVTPGSNPTRSMNLFSKGSSMNSARAWIRVETSGEGLFAIRAEDFTAVGISPASIQRVTVYGGRGVPLPEKISAADSNLLHRVPAIVERSGGTISRVIFYGAGTTGWSFDGVRAGDTVPRRVQNPYVRNVSYLVAVDGESNRDFPLAQSYPSADVTPSSGISRLLYEEDLVNAVAQGNGGIGAGRDWFGSGFIVDEFRNKETKVFTSELHGLDRTGPVVWRVRAGHQAKRNGFVPAYFRFEQNGQPLDGEIRLSSFTGDFQAARADEILLTAPATTVAGDNRSLLGVSYETSISATGYLDFIETHYYRQLRAVDNAFSFESPTGPGIAEYRVTDFRTNQLLGLDVTDPANPIRLQPTSTDGEFHFRAPLADGPKSRRRYYIGSIPDAKPVSNVSKVPFGDLRGSPRSADILVISHEDFLPAANEYAAYRNAEGRHSASVIQVEEIFTEFSSGNYDPTAIRDFVYHAYHHWPVRPSYVVLIGDGHYDYRQISATVPSFIPAYQSEAGDSYNDVAMSAHDDYYVRVDGGDNDRYVDLAIGRFPVTELEEAEIILAKLKLYESPKHFGVWRDRVLLVADDDHPVGDGGGFVRQSERLEEDFLPIWSQPRKLYLPEYPTVSINARRKPGATADLAAWINRGAVITNWVGHGNAKVWSHEHILDKDEFLGRLNNDTALTVITAVTCNFGRFDNPSEISGGELFLTSDNGGAAAVLATTRAVYISPNEQIMREYFSRLFFRDTITNDFLSVGDAMLSAKWRQGADLANDQKYILFGDPTMRLNLPRDSVEISTINGLSPADTMPTIGALSVVTVTGKIRDRNGAFRSDFNGTAIVTLYDAEQSLTLVDDIPREYSMSETGGQLFRGPAVVSGGEFSATFRVPKDISFDTARARIHVYAYSQTEDASGATENLRVYGSDTTTVTDHEGPEITIYLDDRSFMSGDVVTETPMLIVDLADTSGINSSGAGIGHDIEAWIGESQTPINLTEFYLTSPSDYRVGSAERELIGLEPGEYRVRVRAWDIFNNPSETTSWFRVVQGEGEGGLIVTDVVNFPNPMGEQTAFLFRHNQSLPLDVTIDIFSSSGRKLRTLEKFSVTDRFVRIPWDGRDRDGDKLANGVYLYRLRVDVVGDEVESFEVIERVAVAR